MKGPELSRTPPHVGFVREGVQFDVEVFRRGGSLPFLGCFGLSKDPHAEVHVSRWTLKNTDTAATEKKEEVCQGRCASLYNHVTSISPLCILIEPVHRPYEPHTPYAG